MTKRTFTLGYRRKREGKTDYRKRLKLLLSKKPRLVVRRSLKHIWAQVIEYSKNGDRVLAYAHSSELKKLGWKGNLNNIPASYLCGYLIGRKALAKNIGECIFDLGRYSSVKGTAVYAVLKGAIDAGLKIPADNLVFPSDERIKGVHISKFTKGIKDNKEYYERHFSNYIKNKLDPEELQKHFEQVKNIIK